jgi:hypothetical protein
MELTLTGGTAMSKAPPAESHVQQQLTMHAGGSAAHNNERNQVAAATWPHQHNHSHGHHDHNDKKWYHGHNTRPAGMPVSSLLPSIEQVQRFKTNKHYRLNILSNVVRGGTYTLFIELLASLFRDSECKESNTEALSEGGTGMALKDADPILLAQMLDGYGADGHTLAHWCAKRGKLE